MLRVGSNVGVSGLFGRPRTCDVLAVTWMNVQILQRDDWALIEQQYPKEMRIISNRLRATLKHMGVRQQRVDAPDADAPNAARDAATAAAVAAGGSGGGCGALATSK